MHNFEMYQPDNVDEAINLLSDFKKDAWVIAGGKDSLDWFKDRVKTPKVVVDVSGIADMAGVKKKGDGFWIGPYPKAISLFFNACHICDSRNIHYNFRCFYPVLKPI